VGATETTGPWLAEQVEEYTRLFPWYEAYGALLDDLLREAARDHAPLAIVQTRVKSLGSFAEKCLRKRHKYGMPAHELTDLCGGRIIVRTLDELAAVSTAIEDVFDVDWENSLDVGSRLRSAEFGYRSVHYVVALAPGRGPGDAVAPELLGFDCSTCGVRHRLKAEIQVRTTVQHAWADFAHDVTYKGSFRLPERIERGIAGLAAALEDVDRSFQRIQQELETFTTGDGGYLDEAHAREERELLEAVRVHLPTDQVLAARSARLSMRLGEWQRAIDVLEPLAAAPPVGRLHAPLLRDLGIAWCRQHASVPAGAGYRRGQELLEQAIALVPDDTDAVTSLADTWQDLDAARARELYLQAVEQDPADYGPLGKLLDEALGERGRAELLPLLRPLLAGAKERCRIHVELGVNLPWSLFELGRLHLLCGAPYESLHAYALGVSAASAVHLLDEALASLDRLAASADDLEGFGWARRLLLLGRAARFPSPANTDALAALATDPDQPLRGPVIVVAGGTAAAVQPQMEAYRELVVAGLAGHRGSVLSGGTAEGVSGLAADARAHLHGDAELVGYLPRELPADATPDGRYDQLRTTTGTTFSPLEPLQNWIDLLTSGIDPGEVHVLGINGGRIAAVEYRIAAALGATVGLLEESGREAARLLAEAPWLTPGRVVPLPPDAATIRAFLGGRPSELDDATIETVARATHELYRERIAVGTSTDPSLQPWAQLPETLRDANRDQARHHAELLELVGCTLVPVADRPVALMTFSDDEVERMAIAEHGRWTADRLLDGWRWGPDRDVERRTSPYLVPWDQLSEEVREIDRTFVRQLPSIVAEVDLEVRRERRT
jgi:ppGpp synthetase/RelA/SpoT-type nucleotidyltranferase